MNKPDTIVDYASGQVAGHPRRRMAAAILVGVIVLAVAGGWWQWHRSQVQAGKRQWADAMYRVAEQDAIQARDNALKACSEYTASPTRVIYEPDSTQARRLLDSMDGYRQIPDDPLARSFVAGHFPSCWVDAAGSLFYPDADCPGGFAVSPAGIAFLHERTDSGGNRRTVRVAVGIIGGGKAVLMPLVVRLNDHKGQWPRQQALGIYVNADDMLRIYAGQADPNDASRFIIGYELNGTRGAIDGWLDSAEEQIRLKPRTGTVDADRSIPLWIPAELHNLPSTRPSGMPW
jgi:hypothetical protein